MGIHSHTDTDTRTHMHTHIHTHMHMYTHMHVRMDIVAIIRSKLAVESAHRFCVDLSGRSFIYVPPRHVSSHLSKG